MSRSAIFSKLLAAMSLIVVGAPSFGATVAGTVLLVNSHDSNVNKKKDFGGVAVWLVPLDDAFVRVSGKHAEMLQRDKQFTPHILVISTGTTVDFPNLDPIFHNAFSNFDGQIFDISLYPPGSSKSVRFDHRGIVRVFCNIHPTMSSIIVVVNSSYFTITDDDGEFSIANVPPGTYELHFFHERATPETLAKLVRRITIGQPATELAAVTISETGYLPVGHKNKYGRDYPPGADSEKAYPMPMK